MIESFNIACHIKLFSIKKKHIYVNGHIILHNRHGERAVPRIYNVL